MNISALINPVIISGGAGIVCAGALLVALYRAQDTLLALGKVLWQTLTTKAAFFWFVNIVFMGVSVLHAGLFFSLLEPSQGFLGLAPLLGFAVALVLDLASIVFMQARLSALRMNEQNSANWYLLSIIICSGLSAFGNLAMSLEDFKPYTLSNAGDTIKSISPWLGVAFPLLLILISVAADKVLDIDPIHNLDVEKYREQEQKRLGILEARNEFLARQVELERNGKLLKKQATFSWLSSKKTSADIAQLTAMIQSLKDEIDALKEQQKAVIPPADTVVKEPVINEVKEEERIDVSPAYSEQNNEEKEDDSTAVHGIYTDVISEPITDAITESIHAIPAASDASSLNLTQDMLTVVKTYPNVLDSWLKKRVKSVSLEQITNVTGHSKRRLMRHAGKALIRTPKNPDLYTVKSVIAWLKTAPLPPVKETEKPSIKEAQNDSLTNGNGHDTTTVKLDEWQVLEV